MSNEAQDTIILGFGRQSRSHIDVIMDINEKRGATYRVIGFLDDNPDLRGKQWEGYPVLGPTIAAVDYPDALFVNGIWSRHALDNLPSIIKRTGVPAERWPVLVHPLASVSRHARLGWGAFVYPWAHVCCDAELGDFVALMPRSSVGVGTKVGLGSVIGTNCVTAGGVQVGRGCYLGQCSCVREFIKIGDGATVGMGSVVVKDVSAGAVVAGNPARPFK
jgi:sugar O-acyltransferase (sialic acid O-acetyltransferase NeuD family)